MPSSRKAHSQEGGRITARFLRVFLPFSLLFLAAVGIYLAIDLRHEKTMLRHELEQQIELAVASLQRDVTGVIPELHYLVESESLRRFITSDDPQQRAASTADIAAFVRHAQRYDQVRWLDNSGHERLRINHRDGITEICAHGQLQDKSNRYYVQNGLKLKPGEVYISPLDLNIEHGQVEEPHRPMLRFITPTVDAHGERNGLMVFNYQASLMLDNLRASQHHRAELSLLNRDGYWLLSSDPSREWGFMFERDERFDLQHPNLWTQMRKLGEGLLESEAGLFRFATLRAGEATTASSPASRQQAYRGVDARDSEWLLLLHYPEQFVGTLVREHLGLYATGLGLALIFLAAITWRLARSRMQEEQLLERLSLHAKVMETASNGVLITDAQGAIISVNRGFSELTGYSAEEVEGQNPSMLSSGRHGPDFYAGMWQTLEQTGRWEGEIWNRHKNGELFPEWLCISAVYRPDGSLNHYIGIFSLLSEQQGTEARLRKLASSDPLTGLLNRNLLYDRLGLAMASSRRDGTMMAVLFMDLDSFKPINDTLGHAAGDEILKTVADRLSTHVRESDSVARYGGDEFVVLLSGLKQSDEAERLAGKLIQVLQEPILVNGESCQVGVSIGISLYAEGPGGADELIAQADEAMYQAKKAGGGRYALFRRSEQP